MAEGERKHEGRAGSGRSRGPIAIAAVAGVLALAALTVASCGDQGGVRFWQGADARGNSCPRPASMTGSEFNAQETGLRALRRADQFVELDFV